MIKGELTIIFDDPFYKAIFERIDGANYEVAQVNLGASLPHMSEILKLVNFQYSKLHFYQTTVKKRFILLILREHKDWLIRLQKRKILVPKLNKN